jgi:hypothetical protein
MTDATLIYVLWALTLGAVSAVSLPLGSLVGLNVRFQPRYIAAFAACGAVALIAALSRRFTRRFRRKDLLLIETKGAFGDERCQTPLSRSAEPPAER